MFDVLIKGGEIVDGTGKAGFKGDVVIEDFKGSGIQGSGPAKIRSAAATEPSSPSSLPSSRSSEAVRSPV